MSNSEWVSNIEKLAELYRRGELTDEEFQTAKAKLLASAGDVGNDELSKKEKIVREHQINDAYSEIRYATWEGLFIGFVMLVILGFVLAFALGWCDSVE